jgi:hypothetical protein
MPGMLGRIGFGQQTTFKHQTGLLPRNSLRKQLLIQ